MQHTDQVELTAPKPKYTRTTELRHLCENDVFKLATILDQNDCWRKLMEIIPKRLDAQASSEHGALNWAEAKAASGLKYDNEHIGLIEREFKRMNTYQCVSQIMIDEWKTSGRCNERPTLGVLLQLLVQAELFRAADFVALLLDEPKPQRPSNGPAAPIELTSLSEELCKNMDIGIDTTYYPDTETLNRNAQLFSAAINKDFDTKYFPLNKNVGNLNNETKLISIPTPPPRSSRIARQQQRPDDSTDHDSINNQHYHNLMQQQQAKHQQQLSHDNSQNIPNLPNVSVSASNNASRNVSNDVDGRSLNYPDTESTNLSIAPIPLITILIESMNKSSSDVVEGASAVSFNNTITSSDTKSTKDSNSVDSVDDNLPAISALNLNGENGAAETNSPNESEERSSNSSDDVDDDDEEDADISLPNLSIFDQRSSNNDSSLTTVTGTSGENSFEANDLNNDSSFASNDDNIPCLSALQQSTPPPPQI